MVVCIKKLLSLVLMWLYHLYSDQMDFSHIALRRRQPYFLTCLIVNRVVILFLWYNHVFQRLNWHLSFAPGDIKNYCMNLILMVVLDLMAFIKTAGYLAPKISTVSRRLVRVGGFGICWRVGNITSVSNSGSVNYCRYDYRPVTITLIFYKVFELLLAKHQNNFAEKNNFFLNL